MKTTEEQLMDLFEEYGLSVGNGYVEQMIEEFASNWNGKGIANDFFEEVMDYMASYGKGQPIMISDPEVFQLKIWNEIRWDKELNWIFRGFRLEFDPFVVGYMIQHKKNAPFEMWVKESVFFAKEGLEERLPAELYEKYIISNVFHPQQSQIMLQDFTKKRMVELSKMIFESGAMKDINSAIKTILRERYKQIKMQRVF